MRCPSCGNDDTQVKDSRPTEDNAAIRRRRACAKCDTRFTTFERVQLRELVVIKKNGEHRPFDREKLASSVAIAVRKRPINTEQVEMLVNNVVRNLEGLGENEISSSLIGEEVMRALSELDKVSYIRFASVYRDFREVDDFSDFVGTLNTPQNA